MNFSDDEKRCVDIINGNVEYMNRHKRKKKVSVEYYIDDGNRVKILVDNKTIMSMLTIESAMYSIAAISNYLNC